MRILAAVFALAAASATPVLAQSVFDYNPAEFGTRPAWNCGPFSDARPNGPDAEEMMIAFKCREEKDALGYGQVLYLWEDIDFTPQRMRGPTASEFLMLGFNNDDPRIYPFSGTATRINCVRISDGMQNRGANCDEVEKSGEGMCFYTTSSIWECWFNGWDTGVARYGVAPRPAS